MRRVPQAPIHEGCGIVRGHNPRPEAEGPSELHYMPRISSPAEKLCSAAARRRRRRIKIVRLLGDQRLRSEN